MSLTINQLSYTHPNRELLFENISFSLFRGEKASLIGNNGIGKSTLLRIIAQELDAFSGEIIASGKAYYIPQHFGQYNQQSIAEALGVDKKIEALHRILEGDVSIENYTILDDDWNVEERTLSALNHWDLGNFELSQSLESLSGGEKTKVFLSGILVHEPEIILLDEPTNHLDQKGRRKLYDWIQKSAATILLVSHDRALLNLVHLTYELSKNKADRYGGNYEFYKSEKDKQLNALQNQLEEKEKELRKARKTARESMERQQKHDSRGEKQNLRKGVPRIAMGNLKDQAEKSTAKLKGIHENKLGDISENLSDLRNKLSQQNKLKLNFENTNLHSGKILLDAKEINFGYGESFLWKENQTFQIRSGERLVIKGNNGSGKTTLIKLITGSLHPKTGIVQKADFSYIYIDQEYSIIRNNLTLYEQIQEFNSRKLAEHEVKIILNRFLFSKETWDKQNRHLSGGEKMRLLLACFQVSNNMPDLFILDEPTNNLDIQSLEILTRTIRDYQGTVLLISHDEYFIREVGIEREIELCLSFKK